MSLLGNWEETKAIKRGEKEQLPSGGYIIEIMQAYENETASGKSLKISFDIVQGEYAGFYMKKYKKRYDKEEQWKGNYFMFYPKDNDDIYTRGILKGNINAIEKSNTGIKLIPTFDGNGFTSQSIKDLEGKLVGAVMYEKEWEMNGRTGFYTTVSHLETVEDIKNGNYKVPEKKLLKRDDKQADNEFGVPMDGFNEIDDDDMPF